MPYKVGSFHSLFSGDQILIHRSSLINTISSQTQQAQHKFPLQHNPTPTNATMSTPTTPSTTQTTAQKMQTFISAFTEVINRYGGYEIAMFGGGVLPALHPFPPGIPRSRAYPYAQHLINELRAADEPRILELEPLCNLPDEEVQRVGLENKELLADYQKCKGDVAAWRRLWHTRLEGVVREYEDKYLRHQYVEEGDRFFREALAVAKS